MCLANAVSSDALAAFQEIEVGNANICALDVENRLACSVPFFLVRVEPPDDLGEVQAIGLGDAHACVLVADGDARCWGSNDFGQLDVPDSDNPLESIDAGLVHTCAIDTSGTPVCWGENTNGQTSPPDTGIAFGSISAGANHSCGLLATGEVVCWGANDAGKSDVPTDGTRYRKVAVSGDLSCGLTEAGAIDCWGDDAPLPDDGPFTDVDVGAIDGAERTMVCGIREDGSLDCRFRNPYVGLVDAYEAAVDAVEQTGPAQAVVASPGRPNGCVLLANGTPACWGFRVDPPAGDDEVPTDNPFAEADSDAPSIPGQLGYPQAREIVDRFASGAYLDPFLEIIDNIDALYGPAGGEIVDETFPCPGGGRFTGSATGGRLAMTYAFDGCVIEERTLTGNLSYTLSTGALGGPPFAFREDTYALDALGIDSGDGETLEISGLVTVSGVGVDDCAGVDGVAPGRTRTIETERASLVTDLGRGTAPVSVGDARHELSVVERDAVGAEDSCTDIVESVSSNGMAELDSRALGFEPNRFEKRVDIRVGSTGEASSVQANLMGRFGDFSTLSVTALSEDSVQVDIETDQTSASFVDDYRFEAP